MRSFGSTTPVTRGDRVSVISPSAGLPGAYPWVQDLGLQRLRTFDLEPVEYPTTRTMGASAVDRARDVMAAFADPTTTAVLTSIGGDDQVRLLRYLDPQVFLDHPKPFFGYSDNTHLHHYLWNLGIPSYYGIAVMTQLAMPVRMFDVTVASLERALFTPGEVELGASPVYNDAVVDPSGEVLDWADPASSDRPRLVEPAEPPVWDHPADAVGLLWGGCLESLVLQATTGVGLPDGDALDGTVLMLESAELLPEPWLVDILLTGYGERGWFDRFAAVLVGRPAAWAFDKPNDAPTKAAYRQAQREAVVTAVRRYHPTIPVVQGLDFGHTDPQVVMPLGRRVRLDGTARRIWITY